MRLCGQMVLIALMAGAAGCATSDAGGDSDASVGGGPDAAVSIDAPPAPDAAASVDAAPGAADAANQDSDGAVIDALPPMYDADPPDADPPDAMPPDATPPDAMPDACVPGWIDLLANGTFEAGASSWTQTGGTLIRQYGGGYPWPANDGSWAALLGGVNDAAHELTQQVTVPADATALRVRGARCFVTEETTTLIEYDTLTVQLQGLTTEELIWSNLDAGATCSWAAFTLDSPEHHAGETITLSFAGATDGSLITSFGLDSLVLEAFACP